MSRIDSGYKSSTAEVTVLGIIPTQDTKSAFSLRPKDGFVSKLVHNFLKLVHLSGCFLFKHHIGGGQQQKTCEIL